VAAVDMAEQHVWLYDRNGTPAGGFDLAPANGFVAVSDIALDAGFIYLANRSAHEITVYRPDGQRERSIATPGEAIRLAAADGALYFLAQDGWAWKLDGAGNVRSAWQPAPDGAPSDIAVGPGGRVYVADPRHDRVLVFEPGGQAPAQLPSRPSQSCAVNVDKRAAPAQVYQGEPATVALAVTGGCPLGDGRLDVVLVLDQSGSMTSEGIAAVQSAAIAFLSELNPAGAQVAVVGFSTTATVLKPLGGNLRELVRAVAGITPGGQTNYVDALDKAYNEITGPSSRADVARVVVMMTDGKPTDRAGVAEATARLKGVGVTLYTIGLGQNLDADLLRSMATTPDLYFEAPTETELAEIYVTIARRIAAPNLLRTATVTDELPADMAYVAGSAIPPAQLSGRALTWTLNDVPATGQVLSYLVRPQQPGRRPTNIRAVLDFVDVTGQAGQRTFPVPEITVLARTRWLAHLPVVYRNRCQPQRADVVLVFDTSSSMLEPAAPGSATTKLQAALQAARTFLDAMMLPGDQVALVTFNTDVRLAAPLTGSRAVVEFALAGIQTGTGTRIDLGLRAASAELLSSRHQAHNTPVIVLLTDGLPTAGSEAAALAEARLARSGGAAVFTIGLGSNADLTLLSLLASNPANTFFAPKADALASIYSRIAGKVLCE
jgi:Mg-chelatase subunit ChlD